MLLLFLGIWAWAWSSRRRRVFDQAAQLPLEADEPVNPPPERGGIKEE
jgi:cytochrome c oxidase cbb3-type subunit 4